MQTFSACFKHLNFDLLNRSRYFFPGAPRKIVKLLKTGNFNRCCKLSDLLLLTGASKQELLFSLKNL